MKAQESCWGEENMKLYTVNLKQAIAKCSQLDAPELSLPPFRSPYRYSEGSELKQAVAKCSLELSLPPFRSPYRYS